MQKKSKRSKNVPGYKETNDFDISTKQGIIVKWLRYEKLIEHSKIIGKFEHYLKKNTRYYKNSLKFGYTPGTPHLIIKEPRGTFEKCAIYFFYRKDNKEIVKNLGKSGFKVLEFIKSHNIEFIKTIICKRYLNLSRVIVIE